MGVIYKNGKLYTGGSANNAATAISYNSENSGLEVETVQDAIDELVNKTANLSMEADKITFNKGETTMSAKNIEEALLEIWSELQLRALRNFEVVYMIDAGEGYKEEVQLGATALLPETFIPQKEGYTFVGWRYDTEASNDILTECTVGEDPITLWAVFRKEVYLTYDGSTPTSGDIYTSMSYSYYNNGNISNAVFTIEDNRYTKTNFKFKIWGLGSTAGVLYNPGDSNSIAEDATMYAVWIPTKQTGSFAISYFSQNSQTTDVTFPYAFETVPTVTYSNSFASNGSHCTRVTISNITKTGCRFGFAGSSTGGKGITGTCYWTATAS